MVEGFVSSFCLVRVGWADMVMDPVDGLRDLLIALVCPDELVLL